MTIGADFNLNHFHGGTSGKSITARTGHCGGFKVFWVNVRFHIGA